MSQATEPAFPELEHEAKTDFSFFKKSFLIEDCLTPYSSPTPPTPTSNITPMPSIDLGIIELTYDVNFPTIDFGLELKVPSHIPEYGGKTYNIQSFSLSLDDPSTTISIDVVVFSGSVTVGLNFPRCEIQVSGEVSLDLIVKHYHWKVGPANISYMTPLVFAEPSWSVNPEILDPAALQAAVNSAPPPGSSSGPPMANDAATKAKIVALLTFGGAAGLITDLIAGAVKLSGDLQRDLASQPEHPLAKLMAGSSGGVVIAFGTGASIGVGIAGSAAYGFYVTTDGDFGYYGSVALGLGLVVELSATALSAIVYWPDAGQTALDCFEGKNFFISADAGDFVCGSVTVSWPESSDDTTLSNVPCGVAVGVGVGGGIPLNFFFGNSQTWINLKPPPSLPPGH